MPYRVAVRAPFTHAALRLHATGLRWLERTAARLRPSRRPPAHLALGVAGEREALLHLRSSGYTVVARRWKTPKLRGDLDLVAWQGDTLCFVEVKTRSARNPLDPPEAAVNREKRHMLRRMAFAYLRQFPRKVRDRISVRFDLVSVYLLDGRPEFEVFPGAFGWREASSSRSNAFGV